MDIMHYGTPRRSGRYPWGSGDEALQRTSDFRAQVANLRKEGLSDTEIARGMGLTTTELRARITAAKEEVAAAQTAHVIAMKERGMSNVAIAEQLGISESLVRQRLSAPMEKKATSVENTANMLKETLKEKPYLDVGAGIETQLGVSDTKLRSTIQALEAEGYEVHSIQIEQVGNPGNYTIMKVLTPPGVTAKDVFLNRDQIRMVQNFSEDGGMSFRKIQDPSKMKLDRLAIRYAEDGGTEMDGVIEVRRGVPDLDMGNARYAQVRIATEGNHYIKGMAVYADDLPKGVDVRFNTNKAKGTPVGKVLKDMTGDPENPFGTIVRQKYVVGPDGKKKLSLMNIVNEEGDWDRWSNSLASQMLAKQPVKVATEQLAKLRKAKQEEYDEIMALNNPAVKKRLLQSFSDDVDAAAVHLKAAAVVGQRTQVILPIKGIKESEVYAPQFKDGTRLALVRYPHGGPFEIPDVVVNNRNPTGKKVITPSAKDAIGIHWKVAEKLSGADFDGDTVVAIPNNSRKFKSAPSLAGLKNFDPKEQYKGYSGMKEMTKTQRGKEMGSVTNLITDMTVKGATSEEITRAVRHSMVVIDAYKHKLNYKQSYEDNGIAALRKKYQNTDSGKPGASTLLSRSTAPKDVEKRKLRSMAEGGPIDKKTGEKVYVSKARTYVNKQGKVVTETVKAKQMAEVKDAFKLSSGTLIESAYAKHANDLKAMANSARLSLLKQPPVKYNPAAKKAYGAEVATLKAKLEAANRNRPLERQAQVLADSAVRAQLRANPNMEKDELKKVKAIAIAQARMRVGTTKTQIDITDREWSAIQAGALSDNALNKILAKADLSKVKELATPRTSTGVTATSIQRAKAMLAANRTRAEVAEALGISTSTLTRALNGG